MFQTKRYRQIFAQHQLAGFEQIWNKKIEWFEEPNYRRGGWSGVGQLALQSNGDDLNVFVKKQQNHGRRTLFHPFSGEPTFRREFKRLGFLEVCRIKAPKVVFYEEQKVEGKVCAILATETLLDFQPLDVIAQDWHAVKHKTRLQKKKLLKTIAASLRDFHDTGLVHRALYPKHIFIKDAENQPEVALIDLEKARFNILFLYRAYFDLAALNRHAKYWSRSDRLYFFLQYFQVKRLTKPLRFMCRFILRRSMRR
ncbi:MAG: lipopolysaccharide kinase [Methylophilaceae bacterium]|nr:MAG: lipopolysaccharide kinase [Methylophilaceae bacterium]